MAAYAEVQSKQLFNHKVYFIDNL